MRWGWVLAVLAAALVGLWAFRILWEEPTPPLQVVSPEELLAAAPETVLWESPSGHVALQKIPSGETWRSNPTSNHVLLVLQGRGETPLPRAPGTIGPEELLLVFQGTRAEIRAREELSLLVFSTPPPRAVPEREPRVPGGLLPMRVDLVERFSQPLSELREGLEGSPVFESPTGSVWLLRLRGTWVPDAAQDRALYVVGGRLRVGSGMSTRFANPGQLILLPAAVSAQLEPVGEVEDKEVLLVGFSLSVSPNE